MRGKRIKLNTYNTQFCIAGLQDCSPKEPKIIVRRRRREIVADIIWQWCVLHHCGCCLRL